MSKIFMGIFIFIVAMSYFDRVGVGSTAKELQYLKLKKLAKQELAIVNAARSYIVEHNIRPRGVEPLIDGGYISSSVFKNEFGSDIIYNISDKRKYIKVRIVFDSSTIASIYAKLYTKPLSQVYGNSHNKVRTYYRLKGNLLNTSDDREFQTSVSDTPPDASQYKFWIDTSSSPSVRKVLSDDSIWRDYEVQSNLNPVSSDNIVKTQKELNASKSSASVGDIKYLYNQDDNTIDEFVYYNDEWVKKNDGSSSVSNHANSSSNTNTSTLSIFDIFGDSSAIFAYNLDGDSTDLGGNYNGTDYNSPDYTKSGKFGNSVEFNGEDSYIDTGYEFYNKLGDGHAFSISLWFYSYNVNTKQLLFGNKQTEDEELYIYIASDETIRWKIGDKTENIAVSTLNNQRWYHIVFTFDGSDVKLYLDNSLLSTISHDGNKNYPKHNALIGYFDKSVNGRIDQLRFFNRAITSDEVNTLNTEE